MIRLNLSNGELILLKPSPIRKFRGTKLPGAQLYKAEGEKFAVTVHQFRQPMFGILLRSLHVNQPETLITTEKVAWLRLEVVLSGELLVRDPQGNSVRLLPGQYHITNLPVFQSECRSQEECLYFTAYYSPELLDGLGVTEPIAAIVPRPLPKEMLDIIYEMLDNPFADGFRTFYYSNRIRDLLFSHVVVPPIAWPGDLTPKQVASMYEADRIMAENLDGKITLPALAKMLGTNFVTLKKRYEKVFGIGIIPRMMQRRMDRIKFLLEKTDKPLKDISDMAGYETSAGFITEFRKRFRTTPNEWRKSRRGF